MSGCRHAGANMFDVWSFVHRCTKLKRLPFAPPRHRLRVFGGTLSIEEFRAHTADVPPDFSNLAARVCPVKVRVYEAPAALAYRVRQEEEPTLHEKPQEFALSRSKPLQKDRNIMDRLGFVVKR